MVWIRDGVSSTADYGLLLAPQYSSGLLSMPWLWLCVVLFCKRIFARQKDAKTCGVACSWTWPVSTLDRGRD
jgi:hypothetical protein